MPRWIQVLQRYAHYLWSGSLALLSLVCIGALVGVWLSGNNEADDAFAEGRRLMIALDTGVVEGRRITLDKPLPPPIEPAAKEEPPPEPAAVESPSETSPVTPDEPATLTVPDTASPDAAAPEMPPDEERPPATPTAEPNAELMDKDKLPVIGSDGTKPWRYYSKYFERTRNLPMVAVVVTGLGIGRNVTQEALDLRENFSISFSPYTRDIDGWVPAIRATGHELLIDMPLQPANYPATDPGPQGLILSKGPEDAAVRLQWLMGRFPAFIGMITPQSDAFTANTEATKTLLQVFADRGLLLVMGREPYRQEVKQIIDTTHTPNVVAHILLDEELSPLAIDQRLAQLEERARKTGYAIGVAQAYPITIEKLKAWSRALEEKGVMLVPVSTIAKLRFS